MLGFFPHPLTFFAHSALTTLPPLFQCDPVCVCLRVICFALIPLMLHYTNTHHRLHTIAQFRIVHSPVGYVCYCTVQLLFDLGFVLCRDTVLWECTVLRTRLNYSITGAQSTVYSRVKVETRDWRADCIGPTQRSPSVHGKFPVLRK